MDSSSPTVFSFSRWWGIVIKEFIQLKRDRLTFGMIIGIPIMQLLLFGFAINSDPKRLPTAVIAADQSEFTRSFLAGMETPATSVWWRSSPTSALGAKHSPVETCNSSSISQPTFRANCCAASARRC